MLTLHCCAALNAQAVIGYFAGQVRAGMQSDCATHDLAVDMPLDGSAGGLELAPPTTPVSSIRIADASKRPLT